MVDVILSPLMDLTHQWKVSPGPSETVVVCGNVLDLFLFNQLAGISLVPSHYVLEHCFLLWYEIVAEIVALEIRQLEFESAG